MAVEIYDSLILPNPESEKERQLFTALQDAHRNFAIALDSISAGTDSEKVKASSGDATAGYLDAKVAKSVVITSDKLELSGDSASPGNSKYYGTDGGGTKGFYDLPAAGEVDTDELVKGTSSDPTAGYLDAKVDDVNLDVNTSTYKIQVKSGSNLETAMNTVIDLLSGIIQGDIIFVNKDGGGNLYFDKLSPTKYGDILVCGGPDANPFWDEIDGAPNGVLNDSYTIVLFLEAPTYDASIITMDKTQDKEVTLDDMTYDTNNDPVAATDKISMTDDEAIITMDQTQDTTDTSLSTEITHSIA